MKGAKKGNGGGSLSVEQSARSSKSNVKEAEAMAKKSVKSIEAPGFVNQVKASGKGSKRNNV